MAMGLVHVSEAAKKVGVSAQTVCRWWRRGWIEGEKRRRAGGGRGRVFVSMESVIEHKQSKTVRQHHAIKQVCARELVCLRCIVPGGCHAGDPRCLYHFGEDDSDGKKN